MACAIGTQGPTTSVVISVTVMTAPGDQLAYAPAEIAVPAGAPLRLTFRNGSNVPHNLVFTTGIAAATDTIVEPGESQEVAIAPLAEGTYRFVCTVHEEMSGTLTAGASGGAAS